jgi:TonB family protein
MSFAVAVFVASLVGPPQPSHASCAGGTSVSVELCSADLEFTEADATQNKEQREQHLKAALELYRKAASAANNPDAKVKALDAAARTLDATHLNDPAALELTLRELIGIAPNDVQFMFRLATAQEDQGEVDSAEDTLLITRRQHPQELEPLRMLARFYARRATTISNQTSQAHPAADAPGVPDKDGIYRIGPGMTPPQRTEQPPYPEEAKAAGISGVVLIEVVVNEQGIVSEARVVRSVPMLDEAALATVRKWQFRPAQVGGHPVPARMVVSIMFQDPSEGH